MYIKCYLINYQHKINYKDLSINALIYLAYGNIIIKNIK